MKTVSGAHVYDNPSSGTTVIIVLHQAIHVPAMDCNLICQLRINDVKLDDKPKFLTEDPTDESHAISCDTVYIKTQVFRLLRYYSPAPRNIARSDWATQNITHNMTSSKT